MGSEINTEFTVDSKYPRCLNKNLGVLRTIVGMTNGEFFPDILLLTIYLLLLSFGEPDLIPSRVFLYWHLTANISTYETLLTFPRPDY